MTKTDSNLPSNKNEVDNHIISASVVMIAAFTVVLTIKPLTKISGYLVLACVLLFLISLLTSLWHKVRSPLRMEFFEQRKKEIIYEKAGDIADFCNISIKEHPGWKAECDSGVKGKYTLNAKKALVMYINDLSSAIKEAEKRAFELPLEEKHASFKLYLDRFSKKARYISFFIGTVFFFLSLYSVIR